MLVPKPIWLPCTTLCDVSGSRMRTPLLPLATMRLRSASVFPPTTLYCAPQQMFTPSPGKYCICKPMTRLPPDVSRRPSPPESLLPSRITPAPVASIVILPSSRSGSCPLVTKIVAGLPGGKTAGSNVIVLPNWAFSRQSRSEPTPESAVVVTVQVAVGARLRGRAACTPGAGSLESRMDGLEADPLADPLVAQTRARITSAGKKLLRSM